MVMSVGWDARGRVVDLVLVAGVVVCCAFIAVFVCACPAGHHQLGVTGLDLGKEFLGTWATQRAGRTALMGDRHGAVRALVVGETEGSGHGRDVRRSC